MAEKIRTGVVGLGYFGTFHANHYKKHPASELVAIADPIAERAATITGTYGAAWYPDYRSLIGKVDAVSITAPTALHYAIACDFIDAGIHILVEKPLCEEAAKAIDLTHRAERKGVILNVGHIERFSPAYRALRKAVTAPLLIECGRYATWKERATDVDVVLDLMIHDIDLALDLARAPVAEVLASGVGMMGRGLDAATATIGFAGGAVAVISASRVAPLPSRVIRVHEAGRALAADLTAKTASVFDAASGQTTTLDVVAEDSLGLEITAFLEAVTGRFSDGVDGRAAAGALQVAEAVRKGALASAKVA